MRYRTQVESLCENCRRARWQRAQTKARWQRTRGFSGRHQARRGHERKQQRCLGRQRSQGQQQRQPRLGHHQETWSDYQSATTTGATAWPQGAARTIGRVGRQATVAARVVRIGLLELLGRVLVVMAMTIVVGNQASVSVAVTGTVAVRSAHADQRCFQQPRAAG